MEKHDLLSVLEEAMNAALSQYEVMNRPGFTGDY